MKDRQAASVLRELRAKGKVTLPELKSLVLELRNQGRLVSSSQLLQELLSSGRFFPQDGSTEGQMPTVSLGEGSPSATTVPLGERFRDIRPLGKGGMGDVLQAFDTLLERPVAIKVLRSLGAGLGQVLAEARAQARVDHENVCPIYDVVEKEGQGFVVMRLVPGKSLEAYVGNLSPQEVAAIGVQVARALHAAHQTGLVHRDVKPANILIEPGEYGLRAQVVDFGLSVERGQGQVAGTPGFLAPELAGFGKGDARIDIFGLGATLYYVLSGKLAQPVSSFLRLVLSLKEGTWSPPAMPNPPFPEDLAWILRRAMDPDPNLRYPTALAFAEDLERFLRGEPVTAHPRTLGYAARGIWQRHGRKLSLGLLAGLAVAVAVVATRAILHQREQAELAGQLQVVLLSLEDRYRSALARPRHDISGERRELQEELEKAGKVAAKAGLAQESLLVLLARAHLSLGFPEQAVVYLEQAVNKPRAPELVHGLLGTALLARWQQEWARVAQLPAGETRLAEEKALESLRERARSFLAHAASQSQGKLTQASLAFSERQWQKAVELAMASRGETPWVYETELFLGKARLAWARELFAQGQYQEAMARLQEAQENLRRASELAPSHPECLLELAQAFFEEGNCLAETGGNAEQRWQEAARVGQLVLEVDSQANEARYLVTMAHLRVADYALRRGLQGKAAEELATTLTQAKELSLREPQGSWGPTLAGVAWRLQAQLASSDEEREHNLAQAMESLQQARERNQHAVLAANNLGLLYFDRALSQWERGVWPEEALLRAQEIFQELGESFPSKTVWANLSAVVLVRAHGELLRNHDPAPLVQAADRVLTEALQLNPSDTAALDNRAVGLLELAQYAIHQGKWADTELEQAGKLLDQVMQVNPEEPNVMTNRLRWLVLKLQGIRPRQKEGEALVNQAHLWRERVVDWDADAEAQVWWAAVLWETGRWQGGTRKAKLQRQAWEAWQHAWVRWPHHPDLTLIWLAWRRAEGGAISAAERPLVMQLQSSPFELLRVCGDTLLSPPLHRRQTVEDLGGLWGLGLPQPPGRS